MRIPAGIRAFLALAATLCLSRTASADGTPAASPPPSAPPPAASEGVVLPWREPNVPDLAMRLETGFGGLYSNESDTEITQLRFTLAPEFTYRGTFFIAPMVRMTQTSIGLRQIDSMPFDASLSLPWQPSLGARVGMHLFRYRWFRMSVRGEFEFPLGENQAYVSSFTPRGTLTDVPIDVDTLRNHVRITHNWRSIMGVVTFGADVAWWHPYVDVGVLSLDSRLAVDFDSEAAALLSSADVNPERFYGSATTTFFYMVGSRFDLGRGFGLKVHATLLPTSDRVLFMGETALVVPLDFSSF